MTITEAQRQDPGEPRPRSRSWSRSRHRPRICPALSALLATLSSEQRLTIIIAQRAERGQWRDRRRRPCRPHQFHGRADRRRRAGLARPSLCDARLMMVGVRKGGFRLRAGRMMPPSAGSRRCSLPLARSQLRFARDRHPAWRRRIGRPHRPRGDRRRRRHDDGASAGTKTPKAASGRRCRFGFVDHVPRPTASPMRCSTICGSGAKPKQAGGPG